MTDLVYPPKEGDEATILYAYLDWYRATVLRKTAGLEIDVMEKRLLPSATTMAGLVRHLAYVEMWWFQSVLHGREIAEFPWTDEDPDAEFRPVPGQTAADLRALYERACAESRAAVAGLDLEHRAAMADKSEHMLRRIVVHMIEETARHAGHLDILRELTDGAVGD